MKFTIFGNPITKKNHGIIRMIHNHPIMLPSKQYSDYEKKSKQYIPKLATPINCPITLKCTYYMGTKRKCDLVNLLQATCDILVKYKVLEDDNYTIISSFDGSSVSYDKDNPRVEIEIEKRD